MASMIRLFSAAAVCAFLFSSTTLTFEWLEERMKADDRFALLISPNEERQRNARLVEEKEALQERDAARNQVMDELLAGRLTLFQAAARFSRLHNDSPTFTAIRRAFVGSAEGKALCQEVIAWAEYKVAVEQSPDEACAIRQRLEWELQDHLARYGTVELPK